MDRNGASAGGLLIAPIQEAGADPDRIYAWLQGLESAKANLEAGRLLYVAATRARRRLHLLGEAASKDGVIRQPASTTLLAKLWPVVSPAFDAATIAPPHAVASAPELPDQALIRLSQEWRMPPAPRGVAWSAPQEEARLQDAIEFSWVGETARHVGSVVHRWLQRMAEDGLRGWDATRIGALEAQFAGELAARGVAPREIGAARDRVTRALANALEDARGRWLLGPRDRAVSELRLRAAKDGALRTLIIDRTFFEDGVRWIVDYKTSSHEGAGLEAFLDEERTRYAPQLARYAEALGSARLGLYFPMLRGWREWASEG